ncbi:MAG TPA: hypothetical protein PK970_14350 [Hyphomicrobiaceae bacterium]|nr:hypothetical protein [Hyphomicrobiaceae bacterium]
MNQKPSPALAAFVAVGMFLTAWHLSPSPGDHQGRWILTVAFGFTGLALMLRTVTAAERRPSPWPTPTGKILWALRPRAWMIAWAAILVSAMLVGTPHILFEYPPRTRGGCVYVGLWGAARAPVNGGDWNGCRLMALLK